MILLVGIVAASALATPPAWSTSLWPAQGGSIYADHRAGAVGDLVTIIVDESTSGTTQGTTKVAKTFTINMIGGTGFLSILPPAGFRTGSSGSTDRGATQSGSLRARITVRVAEVLPNGALRLEGSRDVLIKGEAYRLIIEGVVRRLDIAADNTVSSDQVADARITLEGGKSDPPARGPLRFLVNGFRALLRLFF